MRVYVQLETPLGRQKSESYKLSARLHSPSPKPPKGSTPVRRPSRLCTMAEVSPTAANATNSTHRQPPVPRLAIMARSPALRPGTMTPPGVRRTPPPPPPRPHASPALRRAASAARVPVQPASRPAYAQPASTRPNSRPASAQPAYARPASARPATARPATARPATAHPAAARPATASPAPRATPERGPSPSAAASALRLYSGRASPACDASSLYRRERALGKGAFGSVSLVVSLLTRQRAAMKTIDRSKLHTPALRRTVEQEVRVLKRLRHAGVARLFEVISTPRAIHIVMEYSAGGTLQQLVTSLRRLGEARARPLFAQMVGAVDYCHEAGVCHRDLKLDNFVLDGSLTRVQLIDFGLACVCRRETALHRSYGTPCYSAPEIFGGEVYRGPQVDMWSLGVALATMLAGVLPFQACSAAELKRRVVSGRFELPSTVSPEACSLVGSLLCLSPEQRADARAVRASRWLTGVDARLPPPGSDPPAEGTPLDGETIARLEQLGLRRREVEASVNEQLFDHPSACYEMLLLARLRARRESGDAEAVSDLRCDVPG